MRRAFLLPDFHHEVEGLARCLGGSVSDKSSATGVSFDQTFFAKRFHRLAYRSSANAQTLGQLAFAGS